jgi:molybdate transport system ATP-binding protein
MGIASRIKLSRRGFTIDLELSCQPGKLLSVVGPSGGGKTTILRILAGLERPDAGHITCGDSTWADMDKGICLSPQKRRVGYVFQEFTLFPHLNVRENAAFATVDKNTADELLKRLKIWHLRDARPHNISGGERQRVAICQALARGPRALLLDEPFSALDALTRRNLREELKSLKTEFSIPIIHVTHDIREAIYLGDEVLPVVQGRVAHKWMLQFLMRERLTRKCREGIDWDIEEDTIWEETA